MVIVDMFTFTIVVRWTGVVVRSIKSGLGVYFIGFEFSMMLKCNSSTKIFKPPDRDLTVNVEFVKLELCTILL